MKKTFTLTAMTALFTLGVSWAQNVAPESTAQSGGKPVSVIKTSSYQKPAPGGNKFPSAKRAPVVRLVPVAPETTAQSGGKPVSVIKTSSYNKTVPGGNKFPTTKSGKSLMLNPGKGTPIPAKRTGNSQRPSPNGNGMGVSVVPGMNSMIRAK